MKAELSGRTIQGELVKKVEEISGEDLLSCYQCGKCSAGCPSSLAMDLLPNQIMRLAHLGLIEDIANSKTIWLCVSCQTCTVQCPRGVDLAKVMEALRLVTLRQNIDHVEVTKLSKELLGELPQIALVSSFRKFTS